MSAAAISAPLKTLGLPVLSKTPKLATTKADWLIVRKSLSRAGIGDRPYAVIRPGASTLARRGIFLS
jgi:hypothetical protein